MIPAVAVILRDGSERILVQLNHTGQWSLPAGAIEPGETPAHAAVREVREETGLVTRAVRILGVLGGPNCRVVYPSGDQVEYVVTAFECRHVSGTLVDETDETAALRWFAPTEMPPLTFPIPTPILLGEGQAAPFEVESPSFD